MDYNVTAELAADYTPGDAQERVDMLDPRFAAVVHDSGHGGVAVTLTVPGTDVLDALAVGTGLLEEAVLELAGLAILPTAEYDRRAGLEGMLDVPTAAARLRVSQQRIRQLLSEGKLDGTKVGRDWLVSSASVAERIASRGTKW